MTSNGIMIFLALYLENEGLSRSEVGTVAASFSIAAVVARFGLGGWLDRFGRRPFFLWGSLALGALCVTYPYLPAKVWLLSGMRGLQGICFAFYITSLWTWVADTAPTGRVAELQGIFGISGLISGALGPVLAEWAIAQDGFFLMFGLAACVGTAGGVVAATLPDYEAQTTGRRGANFWGVVRSPRLTTMAAATLAVGGGIGLVFTFLAPYARTLGLVSVATFFVAFSMASTAVRVLAGKVIDRVGPDRLIPVFLLIQGSSLVLLGNLVPAHHQLYLTVAGCLNGVGHGVVFPALSLLTMRRTQPEERGTGLAVFTALFDSGMFLGAFASGLMAEQAGYPRTFLAAGSLVMLISLLFWWKERPLRLDSG